MPGDAVWKWEEITLTEDNFFLIGSMMVLFTFGMNWHLWWHISERIHMAEKKVKFVLISWIDYSSSVIWIPQKRHLLVGQIENSIQ